MKKNDPDALRIRAKAICRGLVEQIIARAPTNNPQYGDGLAGIVPILSSHQELDPHVIPDRAISDLYDALVSRIEVAELSAGMFQGLAGSLWAVQQLQRWHPTTLATIDASEAQDELLAGFFGYPASGEYELTTGFLGLATWARSAYPSRRDQICDYTVKWFGATRSAETPQLWVTRFDGERVAPKTVFRKGEVNLGLAHGNPGVITWLAQEVLAGRTSNGLRELLAQSLRALMALRSEGGVPLHFGPTLSTIDAPFHNPLAWCYGGLSVASAIGLAGRALDDAAALRYASDLARSSIDAARSSSSLDNDAGLCHGAASTLYMLGRVSEIISQPEIDEYIPAAMNRLLELLETGKDLAEVGLLAGAAGIVGAFGRNLGGARRRWDIPLLG